MRKIALIAILAISVAGVATAQPMIEFSFGPPPPPSSFWYNAPSTLQGRIDFLDARMGRLKNDGHISPGEWVGDHNELLRIRAEYDTFKARDGGRLNQHDHDAIWRDLHGLSDRLHWQNNYGY